MDDVEGREARSNYLKTLWIPLVAFGLIADVNTINIVHAVLLTAIAIVFGLLRCFASEETQTQFRELTLFGWFDIGIPNYWLIHFSSSLPERGTALFKGFFDMLINAALIFVVVLNMAFPSRRRTGAEIGMMTSLIFVLTGCVAYGVICAREAGLMEYDDFTVNFKIAALSSLMVAFSVLVVRPHSAIILISLIGGFLVAHWLFNYLYSNDVIASKMDVFKFRLVGFFLLAHLTKMIFAALTGNN